MLSDMSTDKELFSRLELDEKCTPKMGVCLVACLLLHQLEWRVCFRIKMQVDGNLNVTVDGQACASMEQRDKILKSYNEKIMWHCH